MALSPEELERYARHIVVPEVGGPGQAPNTGVTVIVAITGELVALVAVNAAILPVPLAARPIDVVLFVQLNTVPGGVPEKVIVVVEAPLHTT